MQTRKQEEGGGELRRAERERKLVSRMEDRVDGKEVGRVPSARGMGRRARDHPLVKAEVSQAGIISFVRRRRVQRRGLSRRNRKRAHRQHRGGEPPPWRHPERKKGPREYLEHPRNRASARETSPPVFACRGKCRAASLHGSWRGKKASRANYLRFPYGFNFSSSFEDLRRIGWILFGWRFGGKRGTRWISFCRDRWNNRKSADLERLNWINFRTIGWIYNSIETWNAKSDD